MIEKSMFNINIYNRTSLKLAMNLLSQNICLPVDKNIGKFGKKIFLDLNKIIRKLYTLYTFVLALLLQI